MNKSSNRAPQTIFHVRSGDEVIVISGGAKGRRAKITRVIRKKNTVILEGTDDRAKGTDEGTKRLKEQGATAHELEKRRLVKPLQHYLRKSQQHPNGGLMWLEGSIHLSNVMKISEYERRQARRAQLQKS
jgi:ribosomal protein L24